MYGYGYNYDHSLTRPPGSLLDRLRRLPAAVIQKITRRPLLSSNGQHSSGGMAQWLEETPGDWVSSEFAEPKQQPETADDQPAARPSVDSSIMTVAEAAIQLEESEEVIEEWCRSGLLPAVRIGKRWLVTGLTVEGSPPATEPNTEQTSDQVEPLRNM
jgi:excisionase family DNA binding protein